MKSRIFLLKYFVDCMPLAYLNIQVAKAPKLTQIHAAHVRYTKQVVGFILTHG